MVSMPPGSVILLKNGTTPTNSIISQRLFILENKTWYQIKANRAVTLQRIAPTYEKFKKNVGVRCIRWGNVCHKLRTRYHTLVYVVIRRACPKILCMHKISNVCRRIDYTLDVRYSYGMHTFSNVAHKLLIR